MKKPTDTPALAALPSDTGLIWERPEPASRPAPSPLSRERIVEAAMALADAEGLGAVSLRKVGAALDAGPMRLYGYLSTKEELLDLMVDAVYSEMAEAANQAADDWRGELRRIAHRTRQACRRHPWFVDLLGGRPHQGPHALAALEASLAALSRAPGLDDIDPLMQAARTFKAFLIGALQHEASEQRMERDSGMDKAQWQAATGPYLQRVIATGRFPLLARVFDEATHPPADQVFDQGLDCVFDGIAARLPRGGKRR